jgi:hypothetical protein
MGFSPNSSGSMVILAAIISHPNGLSNSHHILNKPNTIETQNAGYNRKNRLIRNFLLPSILFPFKLLQITNPLIAKKTTTPILPISTAQAKSYKAVPCAKVSGDKRTKTSDTCSQITSNAAMPRKASICENRLVLFIKCLNKRFENLKWCVGDYWQHLNIFSGQIGFFLSSLTFIFASFWFYPKTQFQLSLLYITRTNWLDVMRRHHLLRSTITWHSFKQP